MLFTVVFVCVVSAASAAIPIWSPNTTCGRSKYADAGDMELPAGFIIGGEAARSNEFPWQVTFRRKATNVHFCGGSIINSRWVLTAAHCVDGEIISLTAIVAGEHTRNVESDIRVTLDVSQIVVHESYSPSTSQYDIALVQTEQDIPFSENIQPVCAPDSELKYEYYKSQCAGWGSLQSGGLCCPQTLQYVTLNVTTNEFCDAVYTRNKITADMICASDNVGGTERDSCQGDSGGPLTIKESNGTFRLVGVVSWGIGCASGYPGVYARVPYFNDWISGKLGV